MANDKCSRYKIVFVIAAVSIALLIIPGAILAFMRLRQDFPVLNIIV